MRRELIGCRTDTVVMDEDSAKMNEEYSRLQVELTSGAGHVRRYVRKMHEPELEDYYFHRFTLFRSERVHLNFV
jgi:hypothetical protein